MGFFTLKPTEILVGLKKNGIFMLLLIIVIFPAILP